MTFHFNQDDHSFAASISAAVQVGNDWCLGGDEGTKICCFRLPTGSAAAASFEKIAAIDLVEIFKLPGSADGEVDLEGMDWDAAGGYLWMIGSHSTKRQDAEPDKSLEKNLKRLKNVTADSNRFLLGRVPLHLNEGKSSFVAPNDQTPEHFAARLGNTIVSSDLTTALLADDLLKPFFGPGEPANSIPGKDNGIDIEGIAWDSVNQRLFVGLRGPVLRGSAILLELEFESQFVAGAVGQLRLKPIGPNGQTYIRHFLDLDGLSIRDLCFQGNDLLILAGPALALDWGITVFRWENATTRDQGENFWWQVGNAEAEPKQACLKRVVHQPLNPPSARKQDRPEAIAASGGDKFVIFCDSPSLARFDPVSGQLKTSELEITATTEAP